jgi:hypothetical protein
MPGNGSVGIPGLLLGFSGTPAEGTPGIEVYTGSTANTGAEGSAAPGAGTGLPGTAVNRAFAILAITEGSGAKASEAAICSSWLA